MSGMADLGRYLGLCLFVTVPFQPPEAPLEDPIPAESASLSTGARQAANWTDFNSPRRNKIGRSLRRVNEGPAQKGKLRRSKEQTKGSDNTRTGLLGKNRTRMIGKGGKEGGCSARTESAQLARESEGPALGMTVKGGQGVVMRTNRIVDTFRCCSCERACDEGRRGCHG